MAGFFDLSDPDNAALIGLASGLLQAGMPSRLPVPLGAALGQGLATGLDAGLAAQRQRQAALRRQIAAAASPPVTNVNGNPVLWPVGWRGLPVGG
jgi:hypothetical protein